MKIIILIPYFGDWPPWFQYFLQTCQANPEIDWLIYSDSSCPNYAPDNVSFVQGSLKDFSLLSSEKLNLSIHLTHPYKICDLRPSFGKIFEDYLQDYNFWGYSDLDLFYGKINHFIKKDLLRRFDVISVREHYFAGHLSFYRNNKKVNNLYKCGYGYKNFFQNSMKHFAYDEKLNIYGKDLSGGKEVVKASTRIRKIMLNLKYWIVKNVLNYPLDMTAIIKKAAKKELINYFAKDMVLSDLWFHKKKIADWEILWDQGVLKDRINNKELLHYHIIESKNHSNFTFQKWEECSSFKISKNGISTVC